MLDFFKQLSLKRSAWIFLAFTAFALESTALYFQYGMGLQPCVLCVYERLATVGLFITGLIGISFLNNVEYRMTFSKKKA